MTGPYRLIADCSSLNLTTTEAPVAVPAFNISNAAQQVPASAGSAMRTDARNDPGYLFELLVELEI